jgi:hypothetical protein
MLGMRRLPGAYALGSSLHAPILLCPLRFRGRDGAGIGVLLAWQPCSQLARETEAEPRVTRLQRAPPSAPAREKPFLVTLSQAVSKAGFFGLGEQSRSR